MHVINEILDQCIVEEQPDCLPSAEKLVVEVDKWLQVLRQRAYILKDDVLRPCRVCGLGNYLVVRNPDSTDDRPTIGLRLSGMPIDLRLFSCSNCGHAELFKQ